MVMVSLVTACDQPEETYDLNYGVKGLIAPAEIIVDSWGVPHIYAADQTDAFFVQGFNAARDRLWQIDLWRRKGLGRLSEVLGPDLVEKDRAARLFNYRGPMEAEWAVYGEDAEEIATAFAAGINAYVELSRDDSGLLPMEFGMLGYAPDFWQPEDIVRIRSNGLWRNVTNEVRRARVACIADIEAHNIRQILEPAWETAVPVGLDPCDIPEEVLETYILARSAVTFEPASSSAASEPQPYQVALVDEKPFPGQGSNNWTIAPSRTETGRPILANDPHRGHSLPSLRYIAHLNAPGLNVIGAGEPALPGISIGHNERIAFGLTIFAMDQEDLYVYETDPDDPFAYRYEGAWESMEVFEEEVAIKGAGSETVELVYTRHGPVIYRDGENNRAFAIRAAWLEPGMAPYFGSAGYMRANNWDEFVKALDNWGAPSENQVYADIDGNIGLRPAGFLPRRESFDGLMPVPGDGRYEWQGFHPMSDIYLEENPERGWAATANSMGLPTDFPIGDVRVGFEWTPQWRRNRIAEVLSENAASSVADSFALQTDFVSLPARRLVNLIKGISSADPKVSKALSYLGSWNAEVTAGSGEAALFQIWFSRHLRQAVTNALVSAEAAVAIGPADTTLTVTLMESPDQRLGANPEALRDAIIEQSLLEAIDATETELGANWAAWAWGDLHQIRYRHPLSNIATPEQAAELQMQDFPRGGSGYTVNNTGYYGTSFDVSGGASFRMVVDVGAWDNAIMTNTPGQSGNPADSHYQDLLPYWATDQSLPLLYSREAIEEAADVRILLTPRSASPTDQ